MKTDISVKGSFWLNQPTYESLRLSRKKQSGTRRQVLFPISVYLLIPHSPLPLQVWLLHKGLQPALQIQTCQRCQGWGWEDTFLHGCRVLSDNEKWWCAIEGLVWKVIICACSCNNTSLFSQCLSTSSHFPITNSPQCSSSSAENGGEPDNKQQRDRE